MHRLFFVCRRLSKWLFIYAKYEAEIDDLGANLEGAKIGLVVPAYMDIDSIEDLVE